MIFFLFLIDTVSKDSHLRTCDQIFSSVEHVLLKMNEKFGTEGLISKHNFIHRAHSTDLVYITQ